MPFQRLVILLLLLFTPRFLLLLDTSNFHTTLRILEFTIFVPIRPETELLALQRLRRLHHYVGRAGPEPGDDTVTIIDLGVSPPKVIGELKAPSSVVGPPQNVAIAPDESIALVASSMKLSAQDGSGRAPNHPFYNDNSLVVLYSANGTNFTKVAEAKIGKWSQGVVWSRDGKTLLVQGMVENSLSVLSFDGNSLNVMGEIKVKGGPEGLRTSEH